MRIIYTDEMKRLKAIYKPYLQGARLRDDAPKEAVEASKKFGELLHEIYKKAGYEE